MMPVTYIDPTIVYLFLLLGLWLGVTATYIPGTGVLEVLAGAAVIGTLMALGNMPTNWVAVVLLVLGVLSFMVMPFLQKQFITLAVGGLVLQAIGAWFMFYELTVSPIIIAITVFLPLLYHRYVLLPILAKARSASPIDNTNTPVGAYGRVVKTLDPIGTVQIRGELWTAHSDRHLKPGTEVVVIERDGLNIYVEGIKSKYDSHKKTDEE